MDLIKKRKLDDNGLLIPTTFDNQLSVEDAAKLLESFTQDQLLQIVANAAVRHHDVLDAVRSIADNDISHRKLFVRGLGWDTTDQSLRNLFSTYGEIVEAIVVLDKATGKSKGYGFVIFKHRDGALLALKEPSKKIDGRMAVTQLASAGITTTGPVPQTLAVAESRKIYIANVPQDMPGERLLAHFSSYGEVEEGPLGFDKATGKFRGYALFVYKTAEAARASLVDPIKTIDGHTLTCKFATEGSGKKGAKTGTAPGGAVAGNGAGASQVPVQGQVPPNVNLGQQAYGDGHSLNPVGSGSGMFGSQFGGGISAYGGYSGQNPLAHTHYTGNLNSSLGGGPALPSLGGGIGAGLSLVGSQAPGSLGGFSGGFGSGIGGPYGGSPFAGPTHYSGLSGLGSASSVGLGGIGGGIGAGSGVGLGGVGMGGSGRGSLYSLPPTGSGGQPESAHYSLSSGSVYQNQQQQTTGNSPMTRVPPGGMYHGHSMPPYR